MLSIVFSLWFEPDTSAAVYTEPIVGLVDHTDLRLSLKKDRLLGLTLRTEIFIYLPKRECFI